MPIHKDWVSMIKSMNKTYPDGEKKCYDLAGGGKICASKKAWSVFFAKIKEMGKKETQPRSKNVEESENEEQSEMEKDQWIDWFLKIKGIVDEEKDKE